MSVITFEGGLSEQKSITYVIQTISIKKYLEYSVW